MEFAEIHPRQKHDITSAEPMGDTTLQMEFVDPVNEQYHKSGSG